MPATDRHHPLPLNNVKPILNNMVRSPSVREYGPLRNLTPEVRAAQTDMDAANGSAKFMAGDVSPSPATPIQNLVKEQIAKEKAAKDAMAGRGAAANAAQERWLQGQEHRAKQAHINEVMRREEMNARGAAANAAQERRLQGQEYRGAAPTFWQSVMGTVNRWGGNVSKWFNAEQFDQNNVLTKVGLGNWARVGTAAVAAGALTAAYYAWKKQQEKEEKRAGGLQPSNASYIPEFSSEMLMEMERSEMITQMLDEADDESDIKEKGGLEQAANKMVVSIQKDSSRAIKLLQKAFADKRFDEAPDDLKQQMQAVAQMLATQPA